MDYTLKKDTEIIDNIKAALTKKLVVKVGILAGDKERNDGESNAEIGLKMEFGSISEHIPARSFLRMPIESHAKELRDYVAKNQGIKAALLKGDAVKALNILGLKAEDIIRKAFESSGFGRWAANSPVTIALKGSSKPLIDTSQLRRVITHKVGKNENS